MKDNFYRAFEEKYRGSREDIKKRLEVYLPFILPLHEKYPKGIVVDIGCGRGEFIELMQEVQISAKGIDLDEGMLEAGLSLGLDMEIGDGLSFLRTMKDDSAIAVTAFHVVEHISFDELQDLMKEAKRVLKPGGLLILETPNPENIRVSSETFYLDPTHLRPIPSDLLTFVAEYHGYFRSMILRLQESKLLSAQKYANIGQVIEGVSPDYAIIAQKEAEPEVITLLDAPFSAEYGLPLSSLVEKFERRMLRFEEFVDKMIVKAAKAEEFAWKAEIQAAKANENLEAVKANAEQISHHYHTVVNSHSWKFALPLRLAEKVLRRLKRFAVNVLEKSINISRKVLEHLPGLKNFIQKILTKISGLKRRIRHIGGTETPEKEMHIESPKFSVPDTETVFSDLKKELEKQKEER